jgi:putative ABC transport system permease protein
MRILVAFNENLKMALQALRLHKLRAFLTTLGIIIGVLTIISISTVISGLDKAFSEQISALGSDVLYIQKFPWFAGMDYFKYRNRKDITKQQALNLIKLAKIPQAISYEVGTSRTVKFGGESLKNVRVVGTSEKYEETSNAYPEYGRFLIESDIAHRRNICVLGWEVADELFKNVNPLGQRVKIGAHHFLVVGIMEKKGSIFGFSLDDIVVIPFGVFRKIYGSRRSVTIQVKVGDPALLEQAKDELRGIMRRVRGIAPADEDDFAINQQDTFTSLYDQLTATLYIVAIGIGSISLLVGGIGIMNIMLVSVVERTREIGIRKAIGARRFDILAQFLVEAVIICMLGGIIGILIGFGIGAIIDASTPLPAAISLWSIMLGLIFTSSVGIFFGLYPAAKASKLNPIEALRYE